MSQYSELMGSFVRTGNYPLEANYIFGTEVDLITFFNDPINKTLLHQGLLKIVLNDENNKQALYWVVENNGNLEFSKLISFGAIEELKAYLDQLQEDLEQEIKERKLADQALWGTTDTTIIDQDLNSILKLSRAVLSIRRDIKKLQEKDEELKSELKATVGTDRNNIIDYLETLDYKSLTKVSETLHYFLDSIDEDKDTIDTWPELQAFLEGFKDSDTLLQILTDLWHNIQGSPLPNPPFRTLRGIQDFVEALKSYSINRMNNIQSELDQTQVGVGLSGDGAYNPDTETYYLKDATSVMNALKILDSLINEAINNCHYLSEDTESVKIDIKKEPTKTTIRAWVKTSSENGNDILIKNDGIYHNVDSEFANGILTLKVNGNIRQQHDIGLSAIVEDAKYDTNTEELVIIFKLHNNNNQTVRIPLTNLIMEWIVDNTISSKVVELERVRITGGGPDKLSADVRLSTNKYNILQKSGNTLLVKGTADNIIYSGDVTVQNKIDTLESNLQNEINRSKTIDENLTNSLNNEISRSTLKDNELTNNLNIEIQRAKDAEKDLDNRLKDEIKRSIDKDAELTTSLNNEINRAKTAEHTLEDNLNAEIIRATHEEEKLTNNLNVEITRAKDAEKVLTNNLNSEITRSTNKDNQLQDDLTSEVNRAKNAESTLTTNLNNEITRSTNKDNALAKEISDLITKCIVSGATTADAARTKLAALGTGYSTLEEVAKTLKTFLVDVDYANSTINKWQEIEDFLKGVTDQETLLGLLKDITDNFNAQISSLNALLNAEIQRATNIDNELTNSLNSEITRAKSAESTLTTNLTSEINRAKLAEQTITSNLNNEITRAKDKEELLDHRIDDVENSLSNSNTEINSLKTKTDTINANLNNEINRAKLAEQSLSNDITAETERASNAETVLDNKISNLNTKLTAEETRAKAAEQTLTTNLATTNTNLANEITRSTNKDTVLENNLNSEINRSTTRDNQLATEISDLINKCIVKGQTTAAGAATELAKLGTGYSSIQEIGSTLKTFLTDTDSVNSNINKWKELESFLSGITDQQTLTGLLKNIEDNVNDNVKDIDNKLNNEITRAKAAEKANSDAIAAEVTRSINKDNELKTAIDNEISRATARENALDTRITTNTTNITNEITRAKAAEKTLETALNSEIARSTERDTALNTAITNEITRATNQEALLRSDLQAEISRSIAKENEISNDLISEINRATTAETTLTNQITQEKQRAEASEKNLSTQISNTETSLNNKVDSVKSQLTTQVTNVETQLTKEITNLESQITKEITKIQTELGESLKVNEDKNSLSDVKIITTVNGIYATFIWGDYD